MLIVSAIIRRLFLNVMKSGKLYKNGLEKLYNLIVESLKIVKK